MLHRARSSYLTLRDADPEPIGQPGTVLESCQSQSGKLVLRKTVRYPLFLSILIALLLSTGAAQSAGQSIENLAARAEQFENEGKWQEAESAYREILKIDPRSIAALNRLGAIAVHQQQFRAGIEYYKQALDLNPAEFGTNVNLGIAYIKQQDYRHAVPPLERAVQAAPDSFQARELLAGALIG